MFALQVVEYESSSGKKLNHQSDDEFERRLKEAQLRGKDNKIDPKALQQAQNDWVNELRKKNG